MKRRGSKEAQHERHHAELRHTENELHNTLQGVDRLVADITRAVKVRDCKTARINYAQAQMAFKKIGKHLVKASALHKRLHVTPGAMAPELVPPLAAPRPAPRKAAKPAPAPAPKANAKPKPGRKAKAKGRK